MKKKYRGLPIYMIIIFTLTSCVFGVHEKTNYYKKYKTFLNYTLGGVESFEKEKVEYSGGAPVPTYGSFYKWYIKYKDINGVEKTFILNNHKAYFSSKATDDEYFANQIFEEAINITELQLKEDVLYKYYDKVVFELDKSLTDKENATNYYLYISSGLDLRFANRIEYIRNFIDEKGGVKLSEVTPQTMVSDFGYKYKFVLTTYNENQDIIQEDLDVFKNAIRETAEYLNQETVIFNFRSKNDKSYNCKGFYNNITKEFEIE